MATYTGSTTHITSGELIEKHNALPCPDAYMCAILVSGEWVSPRPYQRWAFYDFLARESPKKHNERQCPPLEKTYNFTGNIKFTLSNKDPTIKNAYKFIRTDGSSTQITCVWQGDTQEEILNKIGGTLSTEIQKFIK